MHSYVLSAERIKYTLLQAIRESGVIGVIKTDRWVLNLGVIPASQFDTHFTQRLRKVFAERVVHEQLSITGRQAVKMSTSKVIVPGELLSQPHLDDEVFPLALCCLTPPTFKTLLQESSANHLQRLLKLLLEGAWQSPKMLPVFWYGRVTASRLSIAAALYLLKSQQGHDWLRSQRSPTVSQVTDWVKAIARGEIPPEQVAQLLTGNRQPACPPLVVMRWLLPLWRQPAVRQVIHQLKGELGVQQVDAYLSRCLQRQDDDDAIRESRVMLAMQPRKGGLCSTNEPLSSSQVISNAGLLLLWPLLPQLFSLLSLCEDQQFISDVARRQAVYCLDRLIWGASNPTDGRLTLNQVLCGVSFSPPVPPTAPLSPLQQQQIDDWLTAVGQQLIGWQKLSLTDIRQLFLQRAGKISTEGAFPQISVRPEPYDYLLRDWPWPMTLASFPWTEQPLTIVWPLNG